LTGVTGFLGCFLLHDLLKQTSDQVYLLIRANSNEEASKRLSSALSQSLIQITPDEMKRVTVLAADLEKNNFGLTDQDYQNLAEKVTSIYHNGAIVNWVFPYSKVRASNVQGTVEIIKLAVSKTLKTLHFVSTIGAASESEDDLPEELKLMTNGYVVSKWVAEKFVRKCGAAGLPITIYRPGMICGHSETGFSHETDFANRYLRGIVILGSGVQSDATLDMTPVDFVSSALVHLSLQPNSLGKAFHLINPHPLNYTNIAKAAISFGYSLTIESYNEWRAKLDDPKNRSNPLWGLLPYLTDQWFSASPTYSCANTLAGLVGTNIRCPEASEKLVHTYLKSLVSRSLCPQV